jgi:hypothetical protein
VDRARADRTVGKSGLTTVEREELTRLRKEPLREAEMFASRRGRPSARPISPARASVLKKEQHRRRSIDAVNLSTESDHP